MSGSFLRLKASRVRSESNAATDYCNWSASILKRLRIAIHISFPGDSGSASVWPVRSLQSRPFS